ncbi:hypothetical protein A2U01_0010981, partial [Trifolium medium]|nr:hypothetical protein [Trifolium medium]MCH90074.1 hypothetical protein [Trifolium medium]
LAIPEEMKHVKVVELLDYRGAWNWSLIQDWIPEHIMHKIAEILPPEDMAGADQCYCARENAYGFSVAAMYNAKLLMI